MEVEFAVTKLSYTIIAEWKHFFAHFVHLVLEDGWEERPESFGGEETYDV